MRTLKLLGARQVLPVLLSSLERLAERETERLLHLLEVVIVRYQLIGGGRTGRLEIACARLANRIYKREIDTATSARDALKDVYPTDEEFKASFLYKQERENHKVKYLFARLEIQARRAEGYSPRGDELEPLRSLTVEHVFPRSPEGEWLGLLGKDPSLADEMTFRLGNECLLTKVNRTLGNRSFEEKAGVFKESELLLTRMISEGDSWERSAIESRQARLAKLAVDYWRFQ